MLPKFATAARSAFSRVTEQVGDITRDRSDEGGNTRPVRLKARIPARWDSTDTVTAVNAATIDPTLLLSRSVRLPLLRGAPCCDSTHYHRCTNCTQTGSAGDLNLPAEPATVATSTAASRGTVTREVGDRAPDRARPQHVQSASPPKPHRSQRVMAMPAADPGSSVGGSVIACMDRHVGLAADGTADATGFEFPADAIDHFWEIYEHTKLWRGCPVSMYAGYR